MFRHAVPGADTMACKVSLIHCAESITNPYAVMSSFIVLLACGPLTRNMRNGKACLAGRQALLGWLVRCPLFSSVPE